MRKSQPNQAGGWVTLALLTLGSAFAAGSAPTGGESKTHVLFMGADISVEQDKDFRPVEEVTDTDLIIKSGGQTVRLPLSRVVDLRINETLKLADASAGIDHLESERAYSVNADPFLGLARSAALAAGESAVADLASGAALQARMGVAGASAVAAALKGTDIEAQGAAALDEAIAKRDAAESRVTQLHNTPQAEVYDVGSQSVKAGGEPMYDAIRLSFEVTAKSDLVQPYCAVIALIRDRDSKPGQARKWAYVRSLGPMSAGEVRNVMVYRGGFPPGYILENCEVHLYNQGEELATNLSRKRVALTDDEAQDYRLFEYLGANKGRTLPAALATTTLTGEGRLSLTKAQLDRTHYVRVTKDGKVAGTFRDAAGKQPLQDPPLEAVLKQLRFKPALEAGKPVEALAPVNLGQLATRP